MSKKIEFNMLKIQSNIEFIGTAIPLSQVLNFQVIEENVFLLMRKIEVQTNIETGSLVGDRW